MSMLDRKLGRDLWRLRGQAITIALVVACGIGGFIATHSTHDSLTRARDRFYESAHFPHLFADLKRAPDAITHTIGRIAGIAQFQTRVVQDVQMDLPGVIQPLSGRIISLPPDNSGMGRLTLRKGQWILREGSDQVLVNERFAQARGLEPGDTLQVLLNGKRQALTVAGIVLSAEYIYATRGGGLPDDEWFAVLWMDAKRLAAAFNMEGGFNSLLVRLEPAASEAAVVRALDRVLEPYGGRGASTRSEQISHKIVSQEIEQQRVNGTILPSIFLAVAVFILNVVLHRQVAAQREQIAALKALGYDDRSIVLHYLKLVAVIVFAGIVLGIALGQWLGHYMTRMYTAFFHFPQFRHQTLPWVIVASAGAALGAAALGTVQAIRRVVTLPPAQAMRPPAPPAYRPALLERMGLSHWTTPAVRMIVRNIERRPVRAAFTVLGIAGSVAILVSGTFWRDAVDYFMDVQFQRAQPGMIYLSFVEPLGPEVLSEVARLPGVVRAEAYRSLAVRLRHGHLTYRAAISGLPAGARLQRAIDVDRGEQAIPPAGLLMNARLARKLDVRAGDRVWIEVLEGKRAVRQVQVSVVFDELVGLNAYMDAAALDRLAAEGPRYNIAALTVDAARRDELLARIKTLPRVSAGIVKASLLESFRSTTARNLLFFTGVLTLFAATIAVGIVYNSARISLAERAWELASLRVLGLTRGEVSALFLGELALMLAAGIPLGFLLGYALAALIVALTHVEAFKIPLVILPRTYAYAGLTVVAAGVLSALIVRHRIDRLDLVAVLKTRE
ncbi:MAG: ABC transporter permease [Burkholderiales bacterium]|nr:ABC transporter permease [Burkholderiales bacterium]